MRLLYAVFLLFCFRVTAQETAASLSYDYSNIYNSGSASLVRNRADFSLTQKKIKLSAGIAAYGVSFDNNSGVQYNNQNISAVHLGARYTEELNNAWDIVADFTPTLVSDLKNPDLKDVYPGFFAGFTYKAGTTKNTRLTFGAGYNGYFGKYRFMPVVNFSGNISEKVRFNAGIPSSWIAVSMYRGHTIKAFATTDGFYSRFTSTVANMYTTTTTVKFIEMVNINSGLEYSYASGDEWVALVKTGYSIYNKLSIPEANNTGTIAFKNNLYIAAGFKYNLNFK